SAGGTTGAYTVQVTLNAALENEGNVPGSTNNTRATAQDLSGSFVTLQTPQTTAQRGAVSGGFTDGDNDFYAFNLTDGQIVTLALVASPLGNALFGTRTDVSAAGFNGPRSVTYGDVNGDGKLDMVVANSTGGSGNSTVTVLLGDGAGGFGSATTYLLGATNPWTVALGDVNGDGKRDIVTANLSSDTLSVLFGNGPAGVRAPAIYLLGP